MGYTEGVQNAGQGNVCYHVRVGKPGCIEVTGELSEVAEGGSSLLKDGREAESGFGPGRSRCKGTSSPYARI